MAVKRIGNININYTVPEAQTQIYNALGRDAGQDAYVQGEANPNFFQKRWNSIKNFGQSTLGALYESGGDLLSPFRSRITGEEYYSHQAQKQNDKTNQLMADNQTRMNDIVKGYGYNSLDDYYNALDDAEVNDKAKYNELLNTVQADLKNQSNANMEAMRQNQADYKDYVQNNFASKNLQQDRGKYLGAGINTFSTAADLTGLSATPLANAIQGGVEGIADELEQNGFENFDLGRAGQNVAIGATTGAVTGALNKGISNKLAKNGGNLFKGNNALTRGMNELGSKTALGRVGSTIATGAGRGAVSGAVGGATGAGMSALFNGGDVIGSALEGAKQGAVSGAATGGIMAGANMAISKTPGVGKFYNDLQSAKTRWDQSGDSFNERLTNTFNSGDSGIGNWLNGKPSKLISAAGNLGNSIRDTGSEDYNKAARFVNEAVTGGKNVTDAELIARFQELPTAAQREVLNMGGEFLSDEFLSKLADNSSTPTTANSSRLRWGDDSEYNDYKLFENEDFKRGYFKDDSKATKSRINSYNEASKFVSDIITGKYKNVSDDVLLEKFASLPTDTQNDVVNLGRSSFSDSFMNKLSETIDPYPSLLYRANKGEITLDEVPAQYRDQIAKDVEYLRNRDFSGNPTTAKYATINSLNGERTEYSPAEVKRLIAEYENYQLPKILSGNSSDEVAEAMGDAGVTLSEIYRRANGGDFDPYSKESFNGFKKWVQDTKADLGQTPTLQQISEYGYDPADATGDPTTITADGKTYYKIGKNKWATRGGNGRGDLGSRYRDDQIAEIVANANDVNVNPRQNTPTTAKGWLKRAGERIVEDANNRGVGMSIKNVADDLPEDVRNLKINQWENDPSYRAELEAAETTVAPRAKASQVSGWDRIAQENGYNNYDEVIQRYLEANPGTELNPNGAAGQILTWLDENPNPTTAGGWAKKAGSRILDELNERGVGLGIRNVAEQTAPTTTQATPETEMYRTLSGEQPTTPEATVDEVSPKTSKESRLRYAQGMELLRQYGAVDTPTANSMNAPETFQEIAEMGFTKPGDVEKIANDITGSHGAVSKLTKSVIKNAAPVDTFTGADGEAIERFVDNSIELNSLYDTPQGKAVKRTVEASLRSLPSRAEGSISYTDTAEDTFKLVQNLEKKAAELEGRGGTRYSRPSQENIAQAQVLKDVANLYKERIFDGADVKSALTPEVVADLKQKSPNNEAWAKTVDDFAANAKTPQDLRSFQKPFVRASRFIDNQYAKAAIVGSRTAQSASDLVNIIPATTKAGLLRQAVNVAWNSNPAHRARAKFYGKLADRAAGTTSTPTDVITPAVTPTTTAEAPTPQTQLWNAIGRTEGSINAQNARSANYLANAAQEAEVVPNTGSLEALINPATANAQTSVYNSIYGTPTTTAASQQTSTGYFQPTGDYWTDLIASAMSSAIDDNNVDAFASLYGMYQDAISNLQKQNSTSSEQKLTATQQRANAAMNSLERLSGMTPDLGYNLSNIPLVGNIATFGGNDYESEARSLAQQIGYMVSGSNIKDNEAEAIGKAYVPQPWDSEQTRQSKLRRAYEIISQYQNGYAS